MNSAVTDPSSTESAPGHILVVEDELALQRAYVRVLRAQGHTVDTAADGLSARELLKTQSFDVVVSDVSMPGLDGIGLLRALRDADLDVPMILVTGRPDSEIAHQAVAYGATMFLVKPVEPQTLAQVVAHGVGLRRMARLKREFMARFGPMDRMLADRAGLEITFARALSAIWMAYQPIVTWPGGEMFGLEALVRSTEPALPHPGVLFDAAERIERVPDLGRAIRDLVARNIAEAPRSAHIFVNLHSRDLFDGSLYDAAAPLSRFAERVVLEITERASLGEIDDVEDRVARLRSMGYRIAIDDLGAGYAGLTAFAQVKPDIVKLDMSLVRDVHKEPVKQRLIASVVGLCHEMKMRVVAEGVETADERDALAKLGCDLLQGFFFARPERIATFARAR